MSILLILVMIINGRNSIQNWEASFNPSFVSDWHPIEAQTASHFVTIHHYLNDTPIKVIADVKVKDRDREYIFRGMGGAERDDDKSDPYGGVLVLYDEHKVILIAPKMYKICCNTGVVIYAGSTTAWDGSDVSRNYDKAEVRVRVWKSSDFSEPFFLSNWTYVNAMKGQSIYNKIEHSMDCYPNFVNVQVKVNFKSETFVYEGQGSSSVLNEYESIQCGGAVFGYSNTSIQIWFKKGSVFDATDGWRNHQSFTAAEGHFRVVAWKFPDEHVNVTELRYQTTQLSQHREIDSTLVNAQFEVLEGTHAGYRFYGVGSTMNDGMQYGQYGGMIYAVNTSSVLMWFPNSTNGSIFNIGGMWGDPKFHQRTNNVLFRIEVISWINNGVRCPVTNITVDGASLFITGNRLSDTVKYKREEQYWYVTGDLVRTCQSDNTWSGKPPVFTIYDCQIGKLETNFGNYSITNDSSGIAVKYQCNFGYSHSHGNLERICQLNNTWSGELPVCTLVNCSTEHLNTSISTTLLNITGNRYMDKASYKCSTHHRFISGENYRYCQINSTWSDLPMYCYRCRCPCRNESDETIRNLMSETRKELTAEKDKLSAFIRKKTSAEDNRPAAKGMGMAAGIMLIVFVLCIIIPDVPSLYRHLRGGWKNTKHRSKYKAK